MLIQVNVVGNYVKTELNAITQSEGFPLWAKILTIIVIIISLVYLVRVLIYKYPGNKFFRKINNFFIGIADGFTTIKNLKHRKLFILHTFFIWAMYLLQIYIGFSAMEGTAHLGIKVACSVLALATLAMIATPGGIGSFPFFVMETLAIYSIAYPLGKAFGWLIWGVSTGIIIIVGLAALILLPYSNRKKNENNQGNTSQDIFTG